MGEMCIRDSYVRVDNTNGAQKAISREINKMAKADVETQVYTEFNEQFQACLLYTSRCV